MWRRIEEAALRVERVGHAEGAALVWRAGAGWRMVASSLVGGGLGDRAWVLNMQVPGGYARLDPADHLREVAAGAGLGGPGVAMMTAADVDRVKVREDGGVVAAVTVGLGRPTWAAAPPELDEARLGAPDPATPAVSVSPVPGPPVPGPPVPGPPGSVSAVSGAPGSTPAVSGPPGSTPAVSGAVAPGPPEQARPGPYVPGTINIVVAVPAALSDAALVNAVATATEAKVQALLDTGCACTGTASDAVCVAARTAGTPEPFGGPRSRWGAPLARAVYAAVKAGALVDPWHLARESPST